MSKPGLRLSVVDVVFIALCASATWYLRPTMKDYVWGIPFAAGHFFLFCNVFRVRRTYELLWVAYFFVTITILLALGRFSWPLILAIQSPATIAAIAAEVRSPQYHGIFCRK